MRAICGKRVYPTAHIDQMWSRKLALHQRTASHSGFWPNVVQIFGPNWRTLSHCGLWSNVVQIFAPLLRTCQAADSDQMWSINCRWLNESLEVRSRCKEKVSKDLIPMEVSDRPSNIDQAISSKPEPPQNDGNAFVMPWRKKDVVASAKMTPKDMGMCIDVKGKSYSIFLRCLKIFCMRMLVFGRGLQG